MEERKLADGECSTATLTCALAGLPAFADLDRARRLCRLGINEARLDVSVGASMNAAIDQRMQNKVLCEVEEGLLDVDVGLGRGLEEADAELFGERLGIGGLYCL